MTADALLGAALGLLIVGLMRKVLGGRTATKWDQGITMSDSATNKLHALLRVEQGSEQAPAPIFSGYEWCRCGHAHGAHTIRVPGWQEPCIVPGCGCQHFKFACLAKQRCVINSGEIA